LKVYVLDQEIKNVFLRSMFRGNSKMIKEKYIKRKLMLGLIK